jgi:methionyl-tRNA formyltransferase
MSISLLLFSSAEISLPLFESLMNDDDFNIQGLVCQPDKPVGREQRLTSPSTKQLAEKYDIPVYQPVRLSQANELLEKLRENPPDFILTFAYGQIMNQDWLDLPTLKALNVHTSLLPKYRGASPIQSAILNGDDESGISLMEMVLKMDAGPVAFQDKVNLNSETTAGLLHDELSSLAKSTVPQHIKNLKTDPDQFTEQDESQASHCGKISREDGYIDFKSTADKMLRQYRAYSPWPGIWTTYKGKRLKILDCRLSENPEGLNISGLEILELQLEGKKPLSAKDFLLGQSEFSSESLPS